ncbi:hypothetical protein GGR53DRAFT_264568 [Hypoxylon sp. FL1150]|nr:hypothetical protein GGR53DRAFT_264568 [Hypoxylon sp. FL1150]
MLARTACLLFTIYPLETRLLHRSQVATKRHSTLSQQYSPDTQPPMERLTLDTLGRYAHNISLTQSGFKNLYDSYGFVRN